MFCCAIQAAYTKYLECLRLMSNVLYLDAYQYNMDKSFSESKHMTGFVAVMWLSFNLVNVCMKLVKIYCW